jgi:hypothetical protein
MATGVIKNNTLLGIEEEVTEGTFVAPTADTSYTQTLDGLDFTPAREVIDRNLLDASIGKETPRMGIKSVTGTIPVEWRASGVEGGAPDFDSLLKGAFGSRRASAASTSKAAAHTSTEIEIEDADISKYAVNDIVMVQEGSAFDLRPISAVDTTGGSASITFPFALDAGAPSASVPIGGFTTYVPANTGHPSLSLSTYWGNEKRQASIGSRVASMSLENFAPGQLASLNFGIDGLNFTYIDGVAPHTPDFDSALPPIILQACVFRNGVKQEVPSFAITLSNTVSFLTNTCNENGRSKGRISEREITGSFNPYMDDTTVEKFDDWVAGTEFSLFAFAYNPTSTSGEFDEAVAVWMPTCVATGWKVGEVDGVLVEEIEFRATRGGDGTGDELTMGFI